MKQAKLEFIKKRRGTLLFGRVTEWRWRLTASNGKVLCASSEAFFNEKDCRDNAEKTGFWLNELNDKH